MSAPPSTRSCTAVLASGYSSLRAASWFSSFEISLPILPTSVLPRRISRKKPSSKFFFFSGSFCFCILVGAYFNRKSFLPVRISFFVMASTPGTFASIWSLRSCNRPRIRLILSDRFANAPAYSIGRCNVPRNAPSRNCLLRLSASLRITAGFFFVGSLASVSSSANPSPSGTNGCGALTKGMNTDPAAPSAMSSADCRKLMVASCTFSIALSTILAWLPRN
mmetsp:Transcript_17702/g.42710  ORF Transcript_17702/g.42710 Transcript_17702/m.42710 type:complete len:222 (-) Transcript_17702:257-922(-)